MPATKKKLTEYERLAQWRFVTLVEEVGLAPDDAVTLMNIPDVVNAASKLASQGCPPELIVVLLEE